MQQVKDRVASQARRYVYGTDNSQLRFVANRLGERKTLYSLRGAARTIGGFAELLNCCDLYLLFRPGQFPDLIDQIATI
jgi:hypothetical protein